jgi:carbamoyl-phosphate synthase large subunit
MQIIKKHHVDLVVAGIEADTYKWNDNLSTIESSGTKVLKNNPTLVSICKDKWNFYTELCEADTPYLIRSSLATEFDYLVKYLGLPFILKRRVGFGSKGLVVVDSEETFLKHQEDIGSILMAQTIVGSDIEEYTTSAFCNGTGGFSATITFIRKLSKEGFTDRAEVVHLDEIDEALKVLCKCFNPFGPTNFQFRKHHGELKLLEVNPRISSSTSIRTAFGYNECAMAVDYYLDGKEPTQPAIRQGRAVRYMEDFIFYDDI